MNEVPKLLEKVSLLALEDWGLTLVERLSEAPTFDISRTKYALVEYVGVASGTVVVVCGVELLETLWLNVLGADDDDSSALDSDNYGDAAKELVNIICGNFLTEVYGEDTVFELSVPAVMQIDAVKLDKVLKSRLVINFEADGIPVTVALLRQEDAR